MEAKTAGNSLRTTAITEKTKSGHTCPKPGPMATKMSLYQRFITLSSKHLSVFNSDRNTYF